MLKEAHLLNISPKGSELKAQFDMLCCKRHFKNGQALGYRLDFKDQHEDLPAMVKIRGQPWLIMERYVEGRFELIAMDTSDPSSIKIIACPYLSDILSMIHEGRYTFKF